MKKIVKRSSGLKAFVLFFVLVITVSATLTGCGKKASGTGGNDASALNGKITISGSTSVQPLAQVLADEFSIENPDIEVDVQAGGSSTGIKNVNTNVADVGNSSRGLKEEEKAWGLDEHKIAIDGIAVVLNPKNSIDYLSKDDVVKIFTGEITNWKDVGGVDREIIVVSREEGSGTRGAFEEILKIEGKVRKDALISNENGVVKATVSSKEDAIGYMSLGYIDQSVKAVKVDGFEPSIENIKSGNYSISRPFLMLTKGEIKPQVKAFLDFILSENGQKIVEEEGYISGK